MSSRVNFGFLLLIFRYIYSYKISALKILIVNGPNLNLLGSRQPDVYGHESWSESFAALVSRFEGRAEIDCFQSNSEGAIIDRLHEADAALAGLLAPGSAPDKPRHYDAVVINPGAYSHYSYAIADAIASIGIPAVEVHISNIMGREEHRHTSVTAPACAGMICGLGLEGYAAAIEALLRRKI